MIEIHSGLLINFHRTIPFIYSIIFYLIFLCTLLVAKLIIRDVHDFNYNVDHCHHKSLLKFKLARIYQTQHLSSHCLHSICLQSVQPLADTPDDLISNRHILALNDVHFQLINQMSHTEITSVIKSKTTLEIHLYCISMMTVFRIIHRNN